MLGDVHAVNTVIDEARRMCFVNFGEIVESHLEAVRFVRDACAVPVSRRFRTVVTRRPAIRSTGPTTRP